MTVISELVRATEAEAQANLLAVLELCAAGKLRCSEKTRRPSAATVGLAELAGSRLQLTARGRAALGKPPAETIRSLWQRWLSHAVIDEMGRIEEIKGQRSANVLTAAKTRRAIVADALSAALWTSGPRSSTAALATSIATTGVRAVRVRRDLGPDRRLPRRPGRRPTTSATTGEPTASTISAGTTGSARYG